MVDVFIPDSSKTYRVTDMTTTVTDSVATSHDGASWDKTNLIGFLSGSTKLQRMSGFSTTVTDSVTVIGTPSGITNKGTNPIYVNNSTDKILELTGWTSTVNDSFSVAGVDTNTQGLTEIVGADLRFTGFVNSKFYQTTGFSATISDSFVDGTNFSAGVSQDENDDLRALDIVTDKLFQMNGFSNTITNSVSTAGYTGSPQRLAHEEFAAAAESASNSVAVTQQASSPMVPSFFRVEATGHDWMQNEDFGTTILHQVNGDEFGSGAASSNFTRGITSDGTDVYVLTQELTPNDFRIYRFNGLGPGVADSLSVNTQLSGGVAGGLSILTDLFFSDTVSDKIWQTSGFTTTISDSISVNGLDTNPGDVSKSTALTYFVGDTNDKLFELLGFSTTVNDSVAGAASQTQGVTTYTGTHLTADGGTDKIYERTGFTTTVTDSFIEGGSSHQSLEYSDYDARIASVVNLSVSNSIAFEQQPQVDFHNLTDWVVWVDTALAATTPPGDKIVKTPSDFSNVALLTLEDPVTTPPANNLQGVTFDGTDLFVTSDDTNKLYQLTGFGVAVQDSATFSISHNILSVVVDKDGNFQITEDSAFNVLKTSGFSSTIADSFGSPGGSSVHGITADFTDTYITELSKALHLSGFSSTVSDSFTIFSPTPEFRGFTFDGDVNFFGTTEDTLGDTASDKLYEFTGFSSTIANSLSVNSLSGTQRPHGIDHSLRLDFDVFNEVAANAVNFQANAIGLKLPLDVDNDILFAVNGVGVVPKGENEITFTQEVISNIKNGVAENTINLTAIVVDLTPPPIDVDNEVAFDVEADAAGSVYTRSVEHEINFDESFTARAKEESASNTVAISQDLYQEHCADSEITFTNAAVGLIAEPTDSEITFDDDVDISGSIWSRSPDSDITFTQVAGAWIANEIGYDPVLFDNDSACLTPPDSITLSEAEFVTLSYLGNSVSFRNPELGNVDVINTRVVNHRTRGNKLVQYRSCQWPVDQIVRMTFRNISGAKKQEIETFLRDTIGKLIQFVDNDNRTWHGVITNPQTVFNLERVGSEYWTFGLEIDVDKGGRMITENVRQTLTFDNEVIHINEGINTFAVNQQVDGVAIKFGVASNTITFTQDYDLIFEESVASSIAFAQLATGKLPVNNNIIFAEEELELVEPPQPVGFVEQAALHFIQTPPFGATALEAVQPPHPVGFVIQAAFAGGAGAPGLVFDDNTLELEEPPVIGIF